MDGWIKLHRSLLDNRFWNSEPFTRGQAWIDLLLLANHEDNFFYLRDHKINVTRGQVGWSQVKLAERWSWSRSKVKKFINDLEKEQQVKQHLSRSTSIITIVNYEKYQQKEQQDKQQKSNRKATEKQQKSINKNDKNDKNDKKGNVKNKFLPERDLLNSVINYFDLDIISNLTKADSEKWLDAIHKLHKIDNYSFEKIKEVIIFGRTDDFWSKNFLSVAGLRKKKNGITKFQQILKNYEHGKNTKSNSKNQRTEKLRGVMQSIADDPDLL